MQKEKIKIDKRIDQRKFVQDCLETYKRLIRFLWQPNIWQISFNLKFN